MKTHEQSDYVRRQKGNYCFGALRIKPGRRVLVEDLDSPLFAEFNMVSNGKVSDDPNFGQESRAGKIGFSWEFQVCRSQVLKFNWNN